MADAQFTTQPISFGDISFNGGLNSAAGPFALSNAESPELVNIDFDIFGSIVSRNGYLNLSPASLGSFNSDGLYWFEYIDGSSTSRKLVNVANGKFYKMDTDLVSGEPDTAWDDATGGMTLTADNMCDFTTWHNKVFVVNGLNTPVQYNGTSLTAGTLPVNVTRPKYIEQFQNYLFYLNVYVNGVREGSRFYWSDLNDESVFPATSFIRVSDNDGTEITGGKVLSDRLVLFKERTIHNVFATFDPDIPFTVQKSNSSVGCVAPWSIQDTQNNIVFLSQDGFYVYDGNNSIKISDKITPTLREYDFSTARSVIYQDKNVYMCSMKVTDGSTYGIFVWNYALNAWSLYKGMTVSSFARVFINGRSERPYFADNSGWVYRMDYGVDDYPLGIQTAIEKKFYTNWRTFEDLIISKSIPTVVLYHTLSDCDLTIAYSFDFEQDDMYTEVRDLSDASAFVWDSSLWDVGTWASVGGAIQTINCTGRGKVVRFGFKNNTKGQSFRIDGLGIRARGETDRG